MPANGGSSDFLLAVEIGELSKLEALAKHLQAIRDAAATPVTFTVNVNAPALGVVTNEINKLKSGSGGGRGQKRDDQELAAQRSIATQLREATKALGGKGDEGLAAEVAKLGSYISRDLRDAINNLAKTQQEVASSSGIIEAIDQLRLTLQKSLLNAVRQAPDLLADGPAVQRAAIGRNVRVSSSQDFADIQAILRDKTTPPEIRRVAEQIALDFNKRAQRTIAQIEEAEAKTRKRRETLLKDNPELSVEGSRGGLIKSGFLGFVDKGKDARDKILESLGLKSGGIRNVLTLHIQSLEREAAKLQAASAVPPPSQLKTLRDKVEELRGEAAELADKALHTRRGKGSIRDGNTFRTRESVAQDYDQQAQYRLTQIGDAETTISDLEEKRATSQQKAYKDRERILERVKQLKLLNENELKNAGSGEFQAILPTQFVGESLKALVEFRKQLGTIEKDLRKVPDKKLSTKAQRDARAALFSERLAEPLSNPLVAQLFEPALGPERSAELAQLRKRVNDARRSLDEVRQTRYSGSGKVAGDAFTDIEAAQKELAAATQRRTFLVDKYTKPRKVSEGDRTELSDAEDAVNDQKKKVAKTAADIQEIRTLNDKLRNSNKGEQNEKRRQNREKQIVDNEEKAQKLELRRSEQEVALAQLQGAADTKKRFLRTAKNPTPTASQQKEINDVLVAEQAALRKLENLRTAAPSEPALAQARKELEDARSKLFLKQKEYGGLIDISSPEAVNKAFVRAQGYEKALRPYQQVGNEFIGEDTPTNFPKFHAVRGVYNTTYDDAGNIQSFDFDAKREKQLERLARKGVAFQEFAQQDLERLLNAKRAEEKLLSDAIATGNKEERKRAQRASDKYKEAIETGGEYYFRGKDATRPFGGFRIFENFPNYPNALSPEEQFTFQQRNAQRGVPQAAGAGAAQLEGLTQRIADLTPEQLADPRIQRGVFAQLENVLRAVGGTDLGTVLNQSAVAAKTFLNALSGINAQLARPGLAKLADRDSKLAVQEGQERLTELQKLARQSVLETQGQVKQATLRTNTIERKEIDRNKAEQQLRILAAKERLKGAAESAGLTLAERVGLVGQPVNLTKSGPALFSQLERTLADVGRRAELVQRTIAIADQAERQGDPKRRDRAALRGTQQLDDLDISRANLANVAALLSRDATFGPKIEEFEQRRIAGTLPANILSQTVNKPFKELVAQQERAVKALNDFQEKAGSFYEARDVLRAARDRARAAEPGSDARKQAIADYRAAIPAYQTERANLRAGGLDERALVGTSTRLRGEVDSSTSLLTRNTSAMAEWARGIRNATPFMQGLIDKFRSLSQYLGAGFILYGAIAGISRLTGEVISLESELAKIRGIFPNRGLSDILLIEDGAIKAAQEYGASIRETVALTKTFAQLGLNPQAALRETRATLLASRGAGIDPQQAVETAVTVRNLSGGRVSSEDIFDRISKIEARNAVTAQDLSVAIQRVGSLATQLQPERLGFLDAFDTVIGATTQIVEATRVTGNQAATSLRFIFARLTAPEIAGKLQNQFGIKLAANEEGTTLRPLLDILSDIADQYKEFTAQGETVKAAQLLQTVAGARQINAAAALFGDFGKVIETATASSIAFGDTQARLILQQDTLEFKLKQLGAATTATWNSFLVGSGALDFFKGAVEKATGVLNFFGGNQRGDARGPATAGTAALAVAGLSVGLGAIGNLASKSLGSGSKGFIKEIATLGVGLARLNPIISGIALVLGGLTLLGGFKLFRNAGFDTERDKFGPRKITAEEILKSQVGTRFGESAAELGVSTASLFGAIQKAADAGREAVAQDPRFKGRDIFGKDYTPSDKGIDRGARELFQETFVKTLEGSVEGIKKIPDPAERTAVALDLLRNSATLAGAALFTQANFINTAQSEFRQNIAADLKEPDAQYDKPLFQSLKDFHIGVAKFLFSDLLPPSKRDKTPFETPTAASASQVIAQRFGPDFIGPLGKVRFKFLERMDDVMKGSALKFTEALDVVTNQFLALNKETRKQVDAVRERVAKETKATGRDLDDKVIAEFLRTGDTDTAGILRNQQSVEDALYQGLRQKFKVDEAVGIVRDAAGNVIKPGAEGEGSGRAFFLGAFQKGMDRVLAELRSAAQTPETAALINTVTRLSDPRIAERHLAQVQDNLGRVRPGRDYTFEVLAQFLRRQDEIKFGTTELRQLGVPYNERQARADASREALQGLSGVRARVEGDLLQALQGYGELSLKVRDKFLALPSGEDIEGRPTPGAAKDLQAYGNLFDSVLQKDKDALGRRITFITDSLVELEKNTPLLGDVGEGYTKQITLLTTRIRDALQGAQPDVELATLTFAQLFDLIRQVAVKAQKDLDIKQLADLRAGFAEERAVGRLDIAQNLREVTSGAALARAGLDINASNLPLALQSAQLNRVSQLERARLDAEIGRRRAFREFGPGGLTESDTQLRNALETIEENRLLAEANALGRERVDIARLLLDKENELLAARRETADSLSRSALGGLREALGGGFNSLRGYDRTGRQGVVFGQLAQRVVEPLASTISERLAENFTESLLGFGGLRQLFEQDLFQEQQLLREHRELERQMVAGAAKQGIIEGIQSVIGIGGGAGAALGPSGGAAQILGKASAGPGLGISDYDLQSFDGYLPAAIAAGAIVIPQLGVRDPLKGVDTSAKSQLAPFIDPQAETKLQEQFRKEQLKRLRDQLAAQVGQQLGGFVGSQFGVEGQNYASEGASLGTAAGSLLGPLGAIGGGILGGIVGGRIGKGKEENPVEYSQAERIEANTREAVTAIENQTRVLLSLDDRLLNAPASFVLPQFRPFSFGGSSASTTQNTYNFTINPSQGMDEETLATKIAQKVIGQAGHSGQYVTIKR